MRSESDESFQVLNEIAAAKGGDNQVRISIRTQLLKGPMQHELHFWRAWPHIRRWKIQNHEAEKELYAQREAMMLALRRVFQQKQLEKSFERWAQAAYVLPPDLVSDDE